MKSGLQMAVMVWIGYNTSGIATAGSGVLCGSAGTAMWNYIGNTAINTALSMVLPPLNFEIGNFDLSISPSIAMGKGWGFGANISATFHAGDFAISGGFGLMQYGGHAGSGANGWEYRKSAMLSYNSKAFSISLGTNKWSGLHSQQTGIIGLGTGEFSLTYENDGSPFAKGPKWSHLGDNNDRWRTAAMTINVGRFHAGFNLFTGERRSDSYAENGDKSWDAQRMKEGPCYSNGACLPNSYVEEKGPRYRMGV